MVLDWSQFCEQSKSPRLISPLQDRKGKQGPALCKTLGPFSPLLETFFGVHTFLCSLTRDSQTEPQHSSLCRTLGWVFLSLRKEFISTQLHAGGAFPPSSLGHLVCGEFRANSKQAR